MNTQLLVAVAVASIVGSLHCVGMCGGFVAFYSAGANGNGWQRLLPHGAYHAGRLVTYSAWGLMAGSIGGLLDVAGHAVGIGRVAAVVAGLVMVVWGLALLAARLGLRLQHPRLPLWGSWVKRQLASLVEKPPILRAWLLGLSSTLLPCGFLYAFVITAAGTGSALGGTAVMIAFWLGTVPLLFGLGLGIEQLGSRLRQFVPTVTAVLMVGLGVYTVIGRVNVAAMAAHYLENGLHGVESSTSTSSPKSADCPCHKH